MHAGQEKFLGLTAIEASRLLAIHGTNEIVVEKKVSLLAHFFSYFKNPLIILLLVAAVLSGIFGELRSSVIIIGMALLSVVMNFYQERKTGQEVEKLKERLALTTTVVRDGKTEDINAKFVVPGDTLALSAGDIVTADGEILSSDDLFVNESVLTGESLPIEKMPPGAGRESRQYRLFAGTNIISGFGYARVTATGRNTAYGNIADRIQAPDEEDPFERGIRSFGYLILRSTIFIVSAVFLINSVKPLLLGHPFGHAELAESFLFAIAIAVGLTPELLPVIMSINMAKGSTRMSKEGVLVKRLNAIPDFGSIDVLCTDKTGTLTEDRITLVKYLDVAGTTSEEVLHVAYLNSIFQTGLKNPLDAAILSYRKIGISGYKKIDEIPYDFYRKRLSVVTEFKRGRQLITKGQPEEIFKICASYQSSKSAKRLTRAALARCRSVHEHYSRQGFKMLAVAVKRVAGGQSVYPASVEEGMTLVGFVGFYDPPKKSAAETLVRLRNYGIEIKIITGDNELVTEKICRELDLPIAGIMAGDEASGLDNEALAVRAETTTIFARFSPDQKNRVINALRSRNKVVGYLGDGINDAPSLKSADVGISVDNAVDVARETADIILTRKSLHVLIEGIIEGRKTFGNTMKYLMMGISSNFGNMFSLVAAAIYLPFLPMQPIQVLLNNTLYDTSQVTIPSDQVDPEYLKKPKHWNMHFIKKFMFVFGCTSSLFDIITFVLLYSLFHLSAGVFQTGWFLESIMTQTLVIFVIRTKRRAFRSHPSRYLIATTLGVVAVSLLFAASPLGASFNLQMLPLPILTAIFFVVALYLVMVELVKGWFYRHYDI